MKIFKDFFFPLLLSGFMHTLHCSGILSHVTSLQNNSIKLFVVKAVIQIMDMLNSRKLKKLSVISFIRNTRCILLHFHIVNEKRHLMIQEISQSISASTGVFICIFFIAFAISKCFHIYNYTQYLLMKFGS